MLVFTSTLPSSSSHTSWWRAELHLHNKMSNLFARSVSSSKRLCTGPLSRVCIVRLTRSRIAYLRNCLFIATLWLLMLELRTFFSSPVNFPSFLAFFIQARNKNFRDNRMAFYLHPETSEHLCQSAFQLKSHIKQTQDEWNVDLSRRRDPSFQQLRKAVREKGTSWDCQNALHFTQQQRTAHRKAK